MIHLELYLALKQAQYAPITLQMFLDAIRGEVMDDPLYQSLTIAVDSFVQCAELSTLAAKRMEKGQITFRSIAIAEVIVELRRKFEASLSEEEIAQVREAAERTGHATWEEYIGWFVRAKIEE